MSLRTSKALPRRIIYQWSLLKSKELKDLYTITIRKKFKSLCTDNETIPETYANITPNEETAKEVLPKRRKDRKRKASHDPRVVKAREELQIASERYYRSQLRITEWKWRDISTNCMSSIILQ